MIRSIYNSSQSVYSLPNTPNRLRGKQPTRMCSAQGSRQTQRLYSAPTVNQPVNNQQASLPPGYYPNLGIVPPGSQVPTQQPDSGDEEEKVAPWIDALIPPKSEVKKYEKVIAGMNNLPDDNPYDNIAEPCISNQAYEVKPNAEMKEVISDVDKDIRESQSNGEQILTAYDPATHAYIEVVNRTGTRLNIREVKKLIVMKRHGDNDWINAYVDGVQFHELLHEYVLSQIPDVQIDKFDQGVRFVMEGDVNDPENLNFEVTTFGQTVFYADEIFNKTDKNEEKVATLQQQYNQAQAQGFRSWTENTFTELINNLKQMLGELQYLAKEATLLGQAAVAPLALHNTIYNEHEVLSASDKERYAEASQLKDRINNLISQVTNFIGVVTNTWNNFAGKTSPVAENRIVPFERTRQAVTSGN
ncbi:MAG: hypothetical protein QNJ31_04585 [Candidatus Caenarcaniphilales bacterium]|nr:hypothetical protein [Candidatus Caenarcaniphilales bacterium]